MKMTLFCNGASCSLIEFDRRFRDAYCFHQLDDGPETSINFYESTHRNIPEDIRKIHFNIIISFTTMSPYRYSPLRTILYAFLISRCDHISSSSVS
jgi:hypothetical protein